jgi:hypothetical protein
MTVLIVVVGIVLGMFNYEPWWFDTRPHYYHMTYNSKDQCQEAREIRQAILKDEGTVCTDKHEMYKTKQEVTDE